MTAARWFWTDEGMEPNEEGEYVLAVSYEGLQRQLTERDARIMELEAAIDKLAQCKGRYHTEANFKALIEVRNKSLHK